MYKTILAAALLIGLVNVQGVRAQPLRIDIEGADFRPYPIAAPDAVILAGKSQGSNKLVDDITRTLQDDVDLARALSLVPPKSYLSTAKEPWNAPNYANWMNVGASGLIRCAVEVRDTSLKMSFRFFNVVSQREDFFRSFEAPLAEPELAIHRFLDELIAHLTGEPGVFSSRLAFIKRTKGGKALFVSQIDGRNMKRMTPTDALTLLPAWDRSGGFLLFTSYLKGNPDLYRLNLADNNLEWLSNKRGLNTGAAVSPDGKKIALTLSLDGNTEIYVMDWQGKNLSRLTDSWGADVSPTWSPDGKRIAFVSSRSGQPHIYVMGADGSNPQRLTFQGTYNQEPHWSPRADGQIAFTARDEFLKYDIFLVDPATKVLTRLTQDEGDNESPRFSPDGQQLVFTSTRPPRRGKKIYIMDVDGHNQRRVSKVPGDYETPAWGPRRPWK
ncbi:MAG: DPP IV N-terminal domain-containing protein [Myxococcota bacterium]